MISRQAYLDMQKRFAEILENSKAYQRLQNILSQPTTREDIFLEALKLCLERAHGKAIQPMEVEINERISSVSNGQLESIIQRYRAIESGNGVEKGK